MKIRATPILEGGRSGNNNSSASLPPTITLDSDGFTPQKFVELLDTHKALVFQNEDSAEGFSTEDFGKFVTDRKLAYYPYIGGAAPRTVIPVEAGKDIIFTANERYVNTQSVIYIFIYLFE